MNNLLFGLEAHQQEDVTERLVVTYVLWRDHEAAQGGKDINF